MVRETTLLTIYFFCWLAPRPPPVARAKNKKNKTKKTFFSSSFSLPILPALFHFVCPISLPILPAHSFKHTSIPFFLHSHLPHPFTQLYIYSLLLLFLPILPALIVMDPTNYYYLPNILQGLPTTTTKLL